MPWVRSVHNDSLFTFERVKWEVYIFYFFYRNVEPLGCNIKQTLTFTEKISMVPCKDDMLHRREVNSFVSHLTLFFLQVSCSIPVGRHICSTSNPRVEYSIMMMYCKITVYLGWLHIPTNCHIHIVSIISSHWSQHDYMWLYLPNIVEDLKGP